MLASVLICEYISAYDLACLPGTGPILSLKLKLINGSGSSLINTFKSAAGTSISYWQRSTSSPKAQTIRTIGAPI